MARAVEDAARERGYSLMFGNMNEDPEKEAEYLDLLLEIVEEKAEPESIILEAELVEHESCARIGRQA